MEEERHSTINFGHRIDAFRVALNALDTDHDSAASVRRMAATLGASCELNNLHQLSTLANAVVEASAETLANRLRELISQMRIELARQEPQRLTILLVSADMLLRNSLTSAFEAGGHDVFTCDSTSAARQYLRDTPPSLLVVDSVLSGEEGLALIPELRSNPALAAMPVLAIIPQHAPPGALPALVHEADAYFNKPVDCCAVVDFIVSHLKRRFELGRPSRRDPLSGLLNRAAFTETCKQLQASARQKDEPLSLAIIGLRDYDLVSRHCDQQTLDDLIRHVGSLLSSLFRTTDVVARWGVSEFAVSLPGEDHFGLTSALEKVLNRINLHNVTAPSGKTIPIKACAGFAMMQPDDEFTEVAAKVEGYLFQAKFGNSGKSASVNIVSDAIPSTQQTGRVALCVGDASLERAITQMCEKDRIDIVVLRGVTNALSRLAESPFNMLIVDDSLPDDGALQLIKSVRESPKLSRFHILVLASNEESVTRTLELGVSDYALKPLVATSFMARLRRVLARREQARTSNYFTVMVVDQSVSQLLIAGTVLFQQTGCNVVLAKGFQEALTRFCERPPDCIVLDCDLPSVALKDFADRLISLPHFETAQVIAASGNPAGASAAPQSLAIKGHILRPYKPAVFLEQIKSIVTLPAPDQGISDRPPIDGEIQRVLSRPR